MHPMITEYLASLTEQHAELLKQLDGLTQAGLEWVPAEGANSLAVIAAHVAGSQKYWLGDVVSGRESKRDRPGEFATKGVGMEGLRAAMDSAMRDSEAVLSTLTPDELTETRFAPLQKGERSVGWVLNHMLAHISEHVGHAQLTRQLWEKRLLEKGTDA
jgi:uncharacterized damage-inducible protein DinB